MANTGGRRDETGIHGKFYEREIALWSTLKCLSDRNVEDFWILGNPKGPEKFDDIVLYIEYVDGRKDLFFLQLKHKETPGLEFPTYLLEGGTKKFQLSVYERDFLNITEKEETFFKPYGITEDVRRFFCIYTNYVKTKEDNHPKIQLKLAQISEINDIVDSSTDGWNCVYKVEDRGNRCSDKFLDQFYLWFNQINEADIQTRICEKFGLNFLVVQSLIYFFVRRFEPPKHIEKLTKKEMIREMLKIFFEGYEIPESAVIHRRKSTSLLQLIKSYEITIIKQSYSEEKIWCDILEEIENRDPSLQATNMNKEILQSVRDAYINLVCDNEIPFFIKTSNRLFQSFKNDFMQVLRSMVIFSDKKENVSFENGRHRVLEYITDLKKENIFYITESLPKISFQGKTPIDLMTLLENNKVKHKVDIDILLKYLDKIITIGCEENIPDYYINRKINIPIMKLENITLKQSGQNTCVQIYFNCTREKGSSLGLKDLMEYLKGRMTNRKHHFMRFFLESSFDLSVLRLLPHFFLGRNRHVHIFEMLDEKDFCTPVYKIGLGQCAITKKNEYIKVDDSTITSFCKHNNVNVICNNAGEGKTILLKYISKKFPPEKCVIKINLSSFSNLSEIKDSHVFIQEVYNIEKKNTSEEFHDIILKIYQICLDKRNVVLLVDDYEEIETQQFNAILRDIQLAGHAVWITTRPFKKSELENYFKINAMELIHVTPAEQRTFFEKYFRNRDKSIDVVAVLKNIDSIRTRMDETFIGIFQQMTMLAEIFKTAPQLSKVEHEIIDIYQKFIEIKMELYPVYHRNMINIVLKKFAFAHLFSHKLLGKYFDIDEVHAQIEFFDNQYQKGSIVTHITQEKIPIFSHKTYAEYLTAKWLADNVVKEIHNSAGEVTTRQYIKEIVKLLYLQRLRTVRYFFDAILTKNIPILSSAVNKNYNLMEIYFQEDPKTIMSEDKLGRTLLHFLIGNEPQSDVYFDYEALGYANDPNILYFNLIDKTILLRVPGGNNLPSEKINYKIWFDRYFSFRKDLKIKPIIGNGFQTIRIRHLKIDLNEFFFLSGSLALLNQLLPSGNIALPILKQEQKYLTITHCIINSFNNILEQMDFTDLDVTLPYAINNSNMSMLHLSIFFNNWVGFNILFKMENRLDKWRADSHGNTILHLASENVDTNYIDCLYYKGDYSDQFLNERNEKGQSLLHSLCIVGSDKSVKKIIEEPLLDIEMKCKVGNTPFVTSIFSENLEVAKLLRKKGVNIDHQNCKGNSALHYACMKNFYKCAEQLIKWNANINLKNNFNLTPLSFAVMNDSKKIVDLLIKHKVDMNVFDKNGWTALHHAVKRDNINLLLRLLQHGAKVNKKNKKKQTALIMACNLRKLQAVELLLQYENYDDLIGTYNYAKRRNLDDVAEKIHIHMKMFSPIFCDQ